MPKNKRTEFIDDILAAVNECIVESPEAVMCEDVGDYLRLSAFLYLRKEIRLVRWDIGKDINNFVSAQFDVDGFTYIIPNIEIARDIAARCDEIIVMAKLEGIVNVYK